MAETIRKAIIFCSVVVTMIGMGLSIAAILTPSWQVRINELLLDMEMVVCKLKVVNLQEYNSIHEHGLWLDCTRHVRDGGGVLLRRFIVQQLKCKELLLLKIRNNHGASALRLQIRLRQVGFY